MEERTLESYHSGEKGADSGKAGAFESRPFLRLGAIRLDQKIGADCHEHYRGPESYR